MAVLLGNAQPAQMPQVLNGARGATAGQGALGGEKGSAEGTDNFQAFRAVMNSLQKKQPDSPEKTANKSAVPAGEGAEDESLPESLALLVNPLAQGTEQLSQLMEFVRAKFMNADFSEGSALSQDSPVGISRFDPDLILEDDFAGLSRGKKAPEGFAKGDPADRALPPVREASPEGAESEIVTGAREELLNALLPPETEPFAAEEGASVGREALEKLAGLAKELLQIAGRRNPALAEQLQNLLQSVREGISPEEIDQAIAAIDGFFAGLGQERKDVSDGEDASGDAPAAAEGGRKEDNASGKAQLPPTSDKTDARVSETRQQRALRTPGDKEIEHDKGSAKSDFSREIASQLRPSLNETAEEAAGMRAGTQRALGEPGASYPLDPNDAFGDGITTMLQFLKDEGIAEARIVVEPPALGRIDVSLQAMATGVEAVFKVDNEHLKQVLQQQLDSLKYSLEAQGIHVSGLTVDIRNRDDGRRQDTREAGGKIRRSDRPGGDDVQGEEDVRLVRLDLEKGLLHWVA